MGDLDLIVGELDDELARGRRQHREALGQGAPHRHFHVMDELMEDVAHQRALAIGKDRLVVAEEVAHGIHQRLAADDGLVAGEASTDR